MSERIRKVNELISREVAGALKKANIDGFITVKAVETNRDMKHATIWISILGGDEDSVMVEIEEKRRDIQRAVNKVMQTKNVPALAFKADHSGEHAEKIEELLRDENSREG